MEGVIAVNKPQGITSADVLRRLQDHFRLSQLFAPTVAAEQERLLEATRLSNPGNRPRKYKQNQARNVKLGHGGTLDPLATGVLIVGVGSGTKLLQNFLGCSKSYETTVLFGTATDTYDILGKVVARKSTAHVTKQLVQEAIDRLRTKKTQRPPIFSALRYQGKRYYEYAREGKELPIEISERPAEVYNVELLEWLEPGTHEHSVTSEEAETEPRAVADREMDMRHNSPNPDGAKVEPPATLPSFKIDIDSIVQESPGSPFSDTREAVMSGALADEASPLADQAPPTAGPACRIRLNVSTGFYVRSFAHDLGREVDCVATMATLVRIRQEKFELGKNALEFSELASGEDVWGPRVESLLEAWKERQATDPVQAPANKLGAGGAKPKGPYSKKRKHDGPSESRTGRPRRNSSSQSDEN